MRVLLTADLHSNTRWFRWLEKEASGYDIIGIAGGLLDLFSDLDPKSQVVQATAFLRSLAMKTSVAVCSGNHDPIDYLPNSRIVAPLWLSELASVDGLIADGAVGIVAEQLVVTTVPYVDNVEMKRCLLIDGWTRSKNRGLPWLVVHHIPPPWHKTTDSEETQAGILVTEFRPDYWFSGHLHELPYVSRSGWRWKVGETTILNAGQRSSAPIPNYVVLSLPTGELTWQAP